MHAPLDLGYLVPNLAGSVLLVALGVWVGTLKPRTPVGTWFAVFAAGYGGSFVLFRLEDIVHAPPEVSALLGTIGYSAWLAGILGLTMYFPRRIRPEDRADLVVAGLLIVGYVVIAAPRTEWEAIRLPRMIVGSAAMASIYALLVVLALRFLREPDAGVRRQLALMSAGLLAYAACVAARGDPFAGSLAFAPVGLNEPWFRAAAIVAVGTLWLAATRGPDARSARNVALLTFALPFYGLAWGRDWLWANPGISRTAMMVVLTYAIVQHRILGVDVKVRWALSKSTVAAVFVAVFFVASEIAQQVLGTTFGGAYAGIIAAGALVFAIAPLQRAAERLAEKAVPVSGAPATSPAPSGSEREEAYRRAVRNALQDRRLTREEERHLFDLAHHLAISPRVAGLIHDEVEREAAPRPTPPGGEGR